MTGILSFLGEPAFWQFNIMELFVSVVIVVGVIWALNGWWKERTRKLNLITFPNEWSATRNLSQDIIEVTAVTDVYLPHHTLSYKGYAYINGKRVVPEFLKPTQSMYLNRRERWVLIGSIALPSTDKNIENVELCVSVEIDGGVRKKSDKRVIPVIATGGSPSVSDQKDSKK